MKSAQYKNKMLCGALDLSEKKFGFFPGVILADKISVIEMNEIVLNIMHNSRWKKSYVQGFDCKYISFKKYVNMFERMETTESIYEGVVEPSY